MRTIDIRKRMFSKIIVSGNGCWEWQGAKNNGYGTMWLEGKSVRVHRVIWELFIAPLTPGLTIDHLCRNHSCCNPHHLEEVSLKENVLRGNGPTAKNARKTYCKHGHAFTLENTYFRPNGTRKCRKCLSWAMKRWNLSKG